MGRGNSTRPVEQVFAVKSEDLRSTGYIDDVGIKIMPKVMLYPYALCIEWFQY